jgi:hypothetical protein
LTRKQIPGVFTEESRREPTSPVANRTRHRLPSPRRLTGLTGCSSRIMSRSLLSGSRIAQPPARPSADPSVGGNSPGANLLPRTTPRTTS